MRSLLAPVAMPILRFATRSYITGPETADAMRVAKAAGNQGLTSTICYWNDGKEDPAGVSRPLSAVVGSHGTARVAAELAVKIPALWNWRDLIAKVVERARQLGRRVVFEFACAS